MSGAGQARARVLLPLLLLAVAAAAVLHLGIARQPPGLLATLETLLALLAGGDVAPVDRVLVVDIRLPRLCTGMFGGAALAIAGTVMQAALRNPLASPEIVGTAAGAAFGGALAIVTGFASRAVIAVPFASLAMATLVTWIVFVLAGRAVQFSTVGLLLAGVALNTLVGALTTFVVSFAYADYAVSSEVMFWLMGGLERATWEHALITAGGAVLFAALVGARARDLDLLTLRDDSSFSLGLDAPAARRWLLWFACGLTATTVANTGGIAFVGLVVPHVARLLVGPAHRWLLPVAALLGSLLLLVADLLCRNAPLAWNLRLGVITSVLGAPYFLYLLARHRRGEALR
jgi:iron complex transport system permease protein